MSPRAWASLTGLAILGFVAGVLFASALDPGRGKLIVLLLAVTVLALPFAVAAVRSDGPRTCGKVHNTRMSRQRCSGLHAAESHQWALLATPGLIGTVVGVLLFQPEAAGAGLTWFLIFGLVGLARRPKTDAPGHMTERHGRVRRRPVDI
jgi:hypothetical protein